MRAGSLSTASANSERGRSSPRSEAREASQSESRDLYSHCQSESAKWSEPESVSVRYGMPCIEGGEA